MLDINQIYLGDCLEVMDRIDDKSVDLIITDPPYNIGKVKSWDKWKTKDSYVEWSGKWILQCQRVLKDNGSFYFFHNDMVQIAMLMEWLRNNSSFVFKQFIVWNKRFEGVKNKGFLDGFVVVDGLRNYQQMAEYCLFYTFQDETGLTTVKQDINNFQSLRKYFKTEKEKLHLTYKQINTILGTATTGGGMASHYFNYDKLQWELPTEEMYLKLQQNTNGFLRSYKSLRQEYESLRYTFNNQKTHHSVWNYEIETGQHPTQKPVALVENVIVHSSNENDTVLDLFAGSGTTAIACINTDRNYILIEKDETYFNLAKDRIVEHLKVGRQQSLFE